MNSINNNAVVRELGILLQLDFDAALAYEIAIESADKTNEADIRDQFTIFRNDHHNHVLALGRLIRGMGFEPPSRSLKERSFASPGFAPLATGAATKTVFEAMHKNELMINRAYADAMTMEWAKDIQDLIARHFADEQRHLAYIEDTLSLSPVGAASR